MKGPVYRFARWCPGALGLWIRQKLFPRYFYSCGKNVLFARFVTLIAPEKVKLGDRVVLNNGAVLDASQSEMQVPGIVLEDDVFVGTESVLKVAGKGLLTVCAGANFSSLCTVRANTGIRIGENCLLAAYCEVDSAIMQDQQEGSAAPGSDGGKGRDIEIGNGCWLGVRMRIPAGVSIGHDTIVGAHSFVANDLPPYSVAVGNPARVIRNRQNGQ